MEEKEAESEAETIETGLSVFTSRVLIPRFYNENPLLWDKNHKEYGKKNIIMKLLKPLCTVGGTVASWLARSTPERALRVRALAGDIVLCSWARHSTLTVPLSTQVYKWVPANLMLGVTLRWTSIPSRGK